MTWAVPDWWALTLLALAVFRVYHLIAEDTILDRPRDWLTARMGEKTELFIVCPWCVGFHLSWLSWLSWIWQPHWTLVAATPFALAALVPLIAVNLDSD